MFKNDILELQNKGGIHCDSIASLISVCDKAPIETWVGYVNEFPTDIGKFWFCTPTAFRDTNKISVLLKQQSNSKKEVPITLASQAKKVKTQPKNISIEDTIPNPPKEKTKKDRVKVSPFNPFIDTKVSIHKYLQQVANKAINNDLLDVKKGNIVISRDSYSLILDALREFEVLISGVDVEYRIIDYSLTLRLL